LPAAEGSPDSFFESSLLPQQGKQVKHPNAMAFSSRMNLFARRASFYIRWQASTS